MKSSRLLQRFLFLMGLILLIASCSSNHVEEIINKPVIGLSEEEIKKIIDDNVVAHAKYTNNNYQYLLECSITTFISNQIPNASIIYGLEYGLDEPCQWYVEFDNKSGTLSPLTISIVINKPEEYLDMYGDYIGYYGTYKALKDKLNSGKELSKNEKDLYNTLVNKFTKTESYMKKHLKARTYVSVNGTRYFFSTIEFTNNSVEVKKDTCYTDEEKTITEVCSWCSGDGRCTATRCNNGYCTNCDGTGYTYTYVPVFGKEMKNLCNYCSHGRCNSCNGNMRCSKCSGKGVVTKPTGGIAKYQGKVFVPEDNSSTTLSSILYDKIINTYWKGESFIIVDDEGNETERGTYDSQESWDGIGFSSTLLELQRSYVLSQWFYQQTGFYPPEGYTIPGIYECHIRIGTGDIVFPIQIKEGYLSYDLISGLTIQSIDDNQLILQIDTYEQKGYITMRKITEETFLANTSRIYR